MSSVMRRSTYVCPGPTGNDFSMLRSDIKGAFGLTAGRSVRAADDDRRKNIVAGPPPVMQP
jgi:hypothetical protein